MRLAAWLGSVAVLGGAFWTLGCGDTTSGGEPQGQAGTGAAGTGGGGNAAGSGGQWSSAGSTVVEHPLEPGECGIVRRLTLPTTPIYPQAPVARQGTSFTLGPWAAGDDSSLVRALLISETGDHRVFEAAGASNDLAWPMFLSGPDLVLHVFQAASGGTAGDAFDSRAWGNGERTPRERGHVLEAQWRGTNSMGFVPALDGQSAVFAMWPQALSEPRAAVLGPDGGRRGEMHAFPTPDAFSDCPAVTPTAHGAFVSFADSNHDLRLFELGPEGEQVRAVTWPLPSDGFRCPSFALAEGGLVFLLDLALAGEPPNVRLYRLDADGAVGEVSLSRAPDAQEVAMLGDVPLLLFTSPSGTELYKPLSGERFPITLPAGTPERVPSEPGNIWLDLSEPDEERTLVQLSCR